MHRKRVTSELHDSYFRLMTIKHSISKIQWAIVWALNYYIIELSWVPKQLSVEFQTVETRYGKEGHTRPRGPSESPDGVDPNIRRKRKTQRDGHNSGVKIWSLCSVSSTLSHANLTNKVRGEYLSKKVFLRLPSCVFIMRPFLPVSSFLRLYRCVAVNYSTYICACM